MISTAVTALALLVRSNGLPLLDATEDQKKLLASEDPFDLNTNHTWTEDSQVTKYIIVQDLFKVVGNPKLPSKVRERALLSIALMCCGEQLHFSKEIIKAFLRMAKDVSYNLNLYPTNIGRMFGCLLLLQAKTTEKIWMQLYCDIGSE